MPIPEAVKNKNSSKAEIEEPKVEKVHMSSVDVLPGFLRDILNDIYDINITNEGIIMKVGGNRVFEMPRNQYHDVQAEHLKKLLAFIKGKIERFLEHKNPHLLKEELMDGDFEKMCVHLNILYDTTIVLLEPFPLSSISAIRAFQSQSEYSKSDEDEYVSWASNDAFGKTLTDFVNDESLSLVQDQSYMLGYKANLMASLKKIEGLLRPVETKNSTFFSSVLSPEMIFLLKDIKGLLKKIDEKFSEYQLKSIDNFVEQTRFNVLVKKHGVSDLSESAKSVLSDIQSMDCLKLHDDWLTERFEIKSTEDGFIEYLRKKISSNNDNIDGFKASFTISNSLTL